MRLLCWSVPFHLSHATFLLLPLFLFTPAAVTKAPPRSPWEALFCAFMSTMPYNIAHVTDSVATFVGEGPSCAPSPRSVVPSPGAGRPFLFTLPSRSPPNARGTHVRRKVFLTCSH